MAFIFYWKKTENKQVMIYLLDSKKVLNRKIPESKGNRKCRGEYVVLLYRMDREGLSFFKVYFFH